MIVDAFLAWFVGRKMTVIVNNVIVKYIVYRNICLENQRLIRQIAITRIEADPFTTPYGMAMCL